MEMETNETGSVLLKDLPVGYRFLPTEEELVTFYLTRKALFQPIPDLIKEISAKDLYNYPPNILVENFADDVSDGERRREWYFFLAKERVDGGRNRNKIIVEKVGNWISNGKEIPIYDSDQGNIFAFKIQFTYFSGPIKRGRRTHWRMEQYHLPIDARRRIRGNEEMQEWVLGKITRGKDYRGSL